MVSFSIFLIFFLESISCYALFTGQSRVLKRAEELEDEYDFVIAGGGTAGLTVGDRLSADGKYSVLVIEYGDDVPAPTQALDRSLMFNITSVPQPELNNRTVSVLLGKAVGGSSAVNGMQAFRGSKVEYDLWAKLGGNGSTWDWDGLLPYFRRGVHFVPPVDYLANDFNITWDLDAWGRDNDTNVFVTYPNYLAPGMKTLYAGMATQPGIEIPRDGNAGTGGLYFWPNTIDPVAFKRSYARTGHWLGLNRSNYDLVVNSSVTRIEFDGDRASGLSFIAVGSTNLTERRFVRARKEVILAAGTIHTPQILQLSGIGPAPILSAANITQKVDLPGVGENFQDHGWYTGINFNWTTPPPIPKTNSSGDPSTSRNLNLGTVIGLPVFSPDKANEIALTYAAQTSAQYLPKTTHPHVLAGYAAQKEAFSSIITDPNALWMWLIIRGDPNFGPANQHHLSRGSVHINASNPTGPPVIDYRAFSNPLDITAAIEMLRFIRRYMASDYFAAYAPFEVSPGANITSDAQLEAWMRSNYIPSVYHPVGTAAKMPRELGGVVDEELRVYGVRGLSVVDASIMPIIPGAPTVLTVYAVAEKAADLIRGRVE